MNLEGFKLQGTGSILLGRFRSGELSLSDFMRECAYWALKDGFDELRVLPYPTQPNTSAFDEYDRLAPTQKLKLAPEFFSHNPEINEYYEQIRMVDTHNRDIFNWLIEVRDNLPEDEFLRKKVEDKIIEFKARLYESDDTVETAKEVFC